MTGVHAHCLECIHFTCLLPVERCKDRVQGTNHFRRTVVMLLLAFLSCWLPLVTSTRPNIIFFLTDDQDITLGGFSQMEKTTRLLAKEGATFKNAFATTPICCPSRSTILTGLYLHNHKAINNSESGGCYGETWRNEIESKTYGALLHDAGYRTFFAGKYLNGYESVESGGPGRVPIGWDWWIGKVSPHIMYYNYTLSVNGTVVMRGDREEDYLTDVLRDYTFAFLNQRYITDNPFLMVIGTSAAHSPYTPANRHFGRFLGANAPRTPNFNVPVNNTKHYLLRREPQVMSGELINEGIDPSYARRLECLLSVDELVEGVVSKLDEAGVLSNTYLIFSTDQGHHLGQFGMPFGKRLPYEFDIRIPFVMRGPGITPGTVVLDPVATIDIAPTFLEIAGVSSKTPMDGESFLSKIKKVNGEFRRTFLVEYSGQYEASDVDCPGVNDGTLQLCPPELNCKCKDSKNNTYVCIRHLSRSEDTIFCQFKDDEGFKELYDISADPHQLTNLALDMQFDKQVAVHEETLGCCFKKIQCGEKLDGCFK